MGAASWAPGSRHRCLLSAGAQGPRRPVSQLVRAGTVRALRVRLSHRLGKAPGPAEAPCYLRAVAAASAAEPSAPSVRGHAVGWLRSPCRAPATQVCPSAQHPGAWTAPSRPAWLRLLSRVPCPGQACPQVLQVAASPWPPLLGSPPAGRGSHCKGGTALGCPAPCRLTRGEQLFELMSAKDLKRPQYFS